MQGALYQKPSHRPYISLTLLSLLALIVYLAVFWPTLTTMELIWRNSETYMHSYLIIPISLWLIWRQRLKLATLTIKPTLLPSLLSVPVLILWLMAYAINVNFVSQFAAIIYLQLMLWSLLGHQVVKAIWFPLAFLIFLVPFGEAAHPILQQITA
ncbi:MAG: archaeosortase/exosortase family protein, partial [Paraglaciecola sp.]|nr:archaeosortase/exosortase family protein [Paraglaciecola sp.]